VFNACDLWSDRGLANWGREADDLTSLGFTLDE